MQRAYDFHQWLSIRETAFPMNSGDAEQDFDSMRQKMPQAGDEAYGPSYDGRLDYFIYGKIINSGGKFSLMDDDGKVHSINQQEIYYNPNKQRWVVEFV